MKHVSSLRQVSIFITLLAASAFALSEEPNDADLQNFLDAYRAGEIFKALRRAPGAFAQTNDPKEIPLARCGLERVDVSLFDAAVLEHARTQFLDRSRLTETTAFLNSPAGIKMTDQIFAALPLLVARIARREDAMPPGTVELSQEEQEQANRFQQTAASKDFQRFLSKFPRVFMDRAFLASMTEARAACERQLSAPGQPPS